ncbi:serine protein kinase [Stachybotrys elegans]|uniref:non-specific serine/threonine protein kinase n=1 Tax=Stachybotrys elegans TaxID=80388 RepID=A0A8K0WM74_9HYPO|nr:serine protein kinase [Stachybotrys elegans]
MGSPPPTPTDDKPRFVPIPLRCEWVEDYFPGGYHPVDIGDTLKNGQYEVTRKLGYGICSTVWLAQDTQSGKYVAIKILTSLLSESSTELEVLQHISKAAPSKAHSHLPRLLDEFDHKGPNGIHKCLCFETMTPGIYSRVDRIPMCDGRMMGLVNRYPLRMAQRILKQTLQAIAFLHEHGIVHGNIQPSNILFPLHDANEELQPKKPWRKVKPGSRRARKLERRAMELDARRVQLLGMDIPRPESRLVRRLDGKKDKWAPEFLHVADPLETFFDPGFKVQLFGMSRACFLSAPLDILPSIELRAPELVLNEATNSPAADIWNFGCLMFELITGSTLFSEITIHHKEDQLLLNCISALGTLPDNLFKQWKTSSLYYTPDGKHFNTTPGGVKEGEEPFEPYYWPLEERFRSTQPKVGIREAARVKGLIRRTLQYNPSDRPTAAELLLDPWFKEIID